MKLLFTEIKEQLSTLLDSQKNPAYIRMWNNQHILLGEGRMELFQTPALFIEFVSSQFNNLVGGEGIQLADPFIINIHILHWQLDAAGDITGDGTFEQNLDVLDFKQKVYKLLSKFKASKSSPFARIAETQDYDHAGVYHYVQSYITTWTDDSLQEPVDGGETVPPLNMDASLTVEGSTDNTAPHIFKLQGTAFVYKYDITLTGTPASGFVQANFVDLTLATRLYINTTDRNSNQIETLLSAIKSGNMVKVAFDVDNYFTYNVTGYSLVSGLLTLSVEYDNSKGALADASNVSLLNYF